MKRLCLLAVSVAAWSSGAAAQTAAPSSPSAPPAAATAPLAPISAQDAAPSPVVPPPTAPADGKIHVPIGFPIIIALDEAVSSENRTRGDKFAIHLAAPMIVNGQTVAPAGAKGEGEVVYAERSGGGGAPGKLVLAARYVDVGDTHIRLKAFNLSAGGESEFREMQMAAEFIGPGVLLINGHTVVYPVGTRAHAKVADEVVFPAPTPAATTLTPPETPPMAAPAAGAVPAPQTHVTATASETAK